MVGTRRTSSAQIDRAGAEGRGRRAHAFNSGPENGPELRCAWRAGGTGVRSMLIESLQGRVFLWGRRKVDADVRGGRGGKWGRVPG